VTIICLEVLVMAFIKNDTQRMTVKEISGMDFQHCLGEDWNSFE
jgi:hypothetical protein